MSASVPCHAQRLAEPHGVLLREAEGEARALAGVSYAKVKIKCDPGGLDVVALRVTTYSEPPCARCPSVTAIAGVLARGRPLDRAQREVGVGESDDDLAVVCATARLIRARQERRLP
jgi:hypothetical protein